MYRIVDIREGKYGVLDTTDGKVDYVTGMDIIRAAYMGMQIQGCRYTNGKFYLGIYKTRKRRKYVNIADLQGV